MDALNRKVMFGWLIGLFLFLWMGCFLGYFVATDEAVARLKLREADWASKSETLQARAKSLSGELDSLKTAFAVQEGELKGARLNIETLRRELAQAQTAMQTEKQLQ